MGGQEVLGALATVIDVDLSACYRDQLAGYVRLVSTARAAVDAFELRIASRADELADAGTCELAATLLGVGGRQSARRAELATRRAMVCSKLPALAQALADGRVSAEHIDAVADVARKLNESGQGELAELDETLAKSAAATSVDGFARECRRLGRILSRDEGLSRHAQLRQQRSVRRWVDRQTGMCKTLISLDPEADAKMWTAINSAVASARTAEQPPDLTWDQLQADTVVDLITGARATDQRSPEVSVIIDFESLKDGLHDDSVCETADGVPLPPDAIRRMACDAEIIPVVLGSEGEVLDVGFGQRLATRAQRRALKNMYSTCAFPGLHRRVRRLPDPSRGALATGRTNQPRQPAAPLRTRTPPPRSRRQMETQSPTRPDHHNPPSRRRAVLRRQHHQPETKRPTGVNSTVARNRSTRPTAP